MSEMKISKVKLDNGQVISFFDTGAVHYDSAGRLVVGIAWIDNLIIQNGLKIVELDDVDAVEFNNSKIVIQDPTDGTIKRHDANNLLEDIGGYSAKVEDNGTLFLKLGKQVEEEEGD